MRLAPPQRRAYTYKVTAAPANLAVSLADVKAHLKVDTSDEDALITIYLQAAIDVAEKLTRRDFITRTYQTFRDFFPSISDGYYSFGIGSPSVLADVAGANIGFEIRRSPLQSIEKVEYLVSGSFTTIATSVYYNTVENDYSELLTQDGQSWPTDGDAQLQSIRIEFKSGFGDDDTSTPEWAKTAIMQHVANLYRNRGDCSCESDAMEALPAAAKMIYLQNRIENL